MRDDEHNDMTMIEERARVFAAGLGVDPDFEIPAEVKRLVDAGETIKAVRELRRCAPGRLGLAPAKRMVDALAVRE